MAEVYRVGLLRMYYSVEPKSDQTPTPFCELRAFMFIEGAPTAPQKKRIRDLLDHEINQLEDIIESVGEQKRAGTIAEWVDPKIPPDIELQRPTIIRLMPPTMRVKVMIEGLEVESIDINEIFETRTGRYFTRETEDAVENNRKFLNLMLDKPQRYFALYDNNGEIRFEYDEADIKGRIEPMQIEKRRIVKAREDLITAIIDFNKQADFKGSIVDIMRIVERQRELRK
jgi:hypothetical protein